jgi:hypothetical protein
MKARTTIRQILELQMISTIFILNLVEMVSIYLSGVLEPAKICDQGGGYLLKYYPLLIQIEFTIISIFFLLLSIRLKKCIYTNIASWLYFSINTVYLIAISTEVLNVFVLGFESYLKIFTITCTAGTSMLFFTFLYKKLCGKI